MPSLLNLFGSLSSNDASTRVKGVKTMLEALKRSQDSHSFEAAKYVSECNEKTFSCREEGDIEGSVSCSLLEGSSLDAVCCEDLAYCIKRLIRGLPSSRECTRQGFSLALCQIIQAFPFLHLASFLELTERFMQVTGGMKGGEEKEIYFGKLFAYAALIRSGVLGDSARCSSGQCDFILRELVVLLRKRSFLRQATAKLIVDLCGQKPELDVEVIFGEGGVSEESSEFVYLSLMLPAACHPRQFELTVPALGELAEKLRDSTSAHPSIHLVWRRLTEVALEDDAIPFAVFWSTLVDELLFNSANHKFKFMGFQLLAMLLPTISPRLLPCLFSENLLRCLGNNLKMKSNWLHKAANEVMKTCIAVAKERKELRMVLLSCTLFTQRTADSRFSNEIKSIIEGLDGDQAEKYMRQLCDRGQTADVFEEKSIFSKVMTLLKNPTIGRHLIDTAIPFFVNSVFVKDSRVSPWKVKRFWNFLDHLLGVDPMLVSRISESLPALEKKAKKALKRLPDTKEGHALRLFVAVTRIEGALSGNRQEAGDNLEDLLKCIRVLYGKKKKKNLPDALNPEEVLTDMVLGLLAKEISFFRGVGQAVLLGISERVTLPCIELLLSVLEVSESVSGHEDLYVAPDNASASESEEEDSDFEGNTPTELAPHNDNDNDNEMQMFDDKLAEIFAEKKRLKSASADAKRQVIQFKFKVISLLAAFYKRNPVHPVTFNSVEPLLLILQENVLKTAKKGEDGSATVARRKLTESLSNLISKTVTSSKDYPTTADPEALLKFLADFSVNNGKNPVLFKAASASIWYAARLYLRLDEEAAKSTLTQLFHTLFREFIMKKSVSINVFYSLIERRDDIAGVVLQRGLSVLTEAIREKTLKMFTLSNVLSLYGSFLKVKHRGASFKTDLENFQEVLIKEKGSKFSKKQKHAFTIFTKRVAALSLVSEATSSSTCTH